MDPKLRLAFCLGLLAIAALEGPRAGSLLAESLRGPYGSAVAGEPAARAAQDGELPDPRAAWDSDWIPEREGSRALERG